MTRTWYLQHVDGRRLTLPALHPTRHAGSPFSDFPVLAIKKIFGFFDILVNVALTQLLSIIDCYWVAATNGQYYPHLTQ